MPLYEKEIWDTVAFIVQWAFFNSLTHRQQWMLIVTFVVVCQTGLPVALEDKTIVSPGVHAEIRLCRWWGEARLGRARPQGTVNGRWFFLFSLNSPTALNVHWGKWWPDGESTWQYAQRSAWRQGKQRAGVSHLSMLEEHSTSHLPRKYNTMNCALKLIWPFDGLEIFTVTKLTVFTFSVNALCLIVHYLLAQHFIFHNLDFISILYWKCIQFS